VFEKKRQTGPDLMSKSTGEKEKQTTNDEKTEDQRTEEERERERERKSKETVNETRVNVADVFKVQITFSLLLTLIRRNESGRCSHSTLGCP
jgi:hypothetical protein